MLVADAIALLEKQPAHMELLIDITRDGEKMFHFKEPNFIDVIEDSVGDKYVVIGCGQDSEPDNSN